MSDSKEFLRKQHSTILICSCCGSDAPGIQWHNQDIGYGLCSRCYHRIKLKETPEYIKRCYGVVGLNFMEE